jgi:glycosyltransferase involved in cell wall biosynthesis
MALNSLLILSPAFPHPPQSGGDIHLFELLRRLAVHFDLHLLSYGSRDVDEFIRQSSVKSVVLIPGGQPSPAGGRLRKKFDLWRGAPHGLRLNVDPVFACALNEMLTRVKPQTVLIEHVYMTQYRQFVGDVPVFVSCHNVETTKMRRWFAGNKSRLMAGLRQSLQIHAMRRCESNLGRLFHTVFATSEVDREELQRMNGRGRFLCVPNGADLKAFTPRSSDSFHGPPAAFFVGGLFYQPNLDAAMMLKNKIWPLVRQAIPDAVCHIAGNHGGLDLNLLNDPNGGVIFHGLVPDIRPYLAMSQAMVVPLQVGSGTRIKIIESMATGTPVVSTRIGAEGIRCTHNKDILLADTTEALAESVISLLRDREAAYRIGKAGRSLVETHYNWDNSAEIMRETIQAAIP